MALASHSSKMRGNYPWVEAKQLKLVDDPKHNVPRADNLTIKQQADDITLEVKIAYLPKSGAAGAVGIAVAVAGIGLGAAFISRRR